MADYPERRRNRLVNMQYDENGAYFITICTRDRQNLFWRAGTSFDEPVSGEAPQPPHEYLNAYGHAVQREIAKFADIYDGVVTVDNSVIMPNHIHLLLSIHAERLGGRRNAAPTISSVVNQFKGSVTKAVGFPCWQKSFHDHIIRNQQDFRKIWEYIDANPGKWTEDRYFIPVDE